MTKLIVLIAVVATFAIAFACTTDSKTNTANLTNTTNSSSTVVKNTPVSTPAGPTDELAAGHQLYADNCAKCHKDTGEGGPTVVDGRKIKPDNLTDDRRKKLSDDKYVKTMVEGVEDEGMPSFKDKMTEAQMREVVKYIRVELQKQDASNVASANTANPTAPPSNK